MRLRESMVVETPANARSMEVGTGFTVTLHALDQTACVFVGDTAAQCSAVVHDLAQNFAWQLELLSSFSEHRRPREMFTIEQAAAAPLPAAPTEPWAPFIACLCVCGALAWMLYAGVPVPWPPFWAFFVGHALLFAYASMTTLPLYVAVGSPLWAFFAGHALLFAIDTAVVTHLDRASDLEVVFSAACAALAVVAVRSFIAFVKR